VIARATSDFLPGNDHGATRMHQFFAAKSRLPKAGAKAPVPGKLRGIARTLMLLTLIGGFLAGLIVLGRLGLDEIRGQDRYLVKFGEIMCEPPPGLERSTFLDEVQYLSRLPEKLKILDEDLSRQLQEGFTRHPWVEKVDEVRLTPPRHIEVKLTLRAPTLAVKWNGVLRVVDGNGVLLPLKTATAGLPVHEKKTSPPQGPEGTRWGDAELEEHARRLRLARP
jgi:hypothetical protein